MSIDTSKPVKSLFYNGTELSLQDSNEVDVSLGITGAAVGQIAKITAVDGTGKSTGWEPVDMVSGGDGGSGFRLIRNLTLAEQADRVDITTDNDGAAFQLTEVYVKVSAQSYTEDGQAVSFLPNGRWLGRDPYVDSANKSSASTATWQNDMQYHAVFGGGVIFAEQLPAKGSNNNLVSKAATGQQIITQISFVSKFAAGCEFLIIGR